MTEESGVSPYRAWRGKWSHCKHRRAILEGV
jgi:hypothetical protein